MRKIEHEQRAILIGLACAFALAWILGMAVQVAPVPVRHVSTILYTIIIIVWVFTVQERILDKKIRRFLMLGAFCLAFLFVLRICRWDIFAYSLKADEFLRYAYYTVYIIVPLASLCAAARIGKGEAEKTPGVLIFFWCMALILCALVMTNRFHGFLLELHASGDYIYRFLYYVVALWYVALTIAALAVLIHRCRLSASRRLWYIPASIAVFSIALMTAYYAIGGAPTAFGLKLYNIQEVHVLLFIGMWECAFQIGLISTNSGYSELFLSTTLEGIIVNKNGEVVFRAQQASDEVLNQIRRAEGDAAELPGGYLPRSAAIHGGQVYWMEDHSAVNALKDNLHEALEQISAENTLLTLENEIKEQRTLVETQNRVYDGIVATLEPQLEKLKAALHAAKVSEGDAKDLVRMAYLAAYIKRRSNLALIAESQSRAELSELYFAIRESLDYAALSGMSCDVRMSESGDISVESLVAAYEFFEYVLEKAADTADTLMVNLAFADGLAMNLMTGTFVEAFPDVLREKLSSAQLRIDRIREEAITYLFLTGRGEEVSAS